MEERSLMKIKKLGNSLVIAFSMYSKIPMPQADWTSENKKYVILIGYTETDVTYVEAKNGKSHTVSLEKMDKKANGNYIGS